MKYKFLDNSPIGKDLFEGKGQEKISEIISEIIKNSKFKVIGIDGGWGTGKSNLVKIIDNNLITHKFFIYDVWGHQEDEQRKSILVELTEFISRNELVSNKKDWDNNLKSLLANTKETKTVNQPYLSVGFIFSLFSIVYVPSVNVFKDSMSCFFGIDSLFWKLVLVMFPLFIVFGIYIYNLINEWRKKSGFCEGFKLAAQETFQVYTNKQKEEIKREIISEDKPSVRDFRLWMKKIDKDLGDKKIVLVFDNFDRLPKQHILSIWSVVHIFFAEESYENIKIIIPFDRLHLKNAFKDLNAADQDFANDYINKTFDIVYRVAPPIMSSWKEFFKNNWINVFSVYDEAEYLKVEQAYEFLRPQITPREILVFINDVVTLKLINDNIPDSYIAVYVLNKDHINKEPLKAVTDLSYLKGIEYVYRDDDDYQKYITALSYQINPENALEVVYKKDLKECLVNGDSTKLIDISKTSVFSRIITPVINEVENYENVILSLMKLNDESLISKIELQSLWNNIYLKQISLELKRSTVQEYQLVLLDNIEDKYKKTWLDKIVKNLYVDESEFNARDFAIQIDKLKSHCNDKYSTFDLKPMLKEKELPIEQFKLLVDFKKEEYPYYKLNCPEYLVKEFLKNRSAENFKEAEYVLYLEYSHDLKDFHNLLKTFISGYESNVNHLRDVLRFLKKTSPEPIENPLNDDLIHNLMSVTNIGDTLFTDLTCLRVKLGTTSNPAYAQIYDKALNSEDEGFYEDVSETIESFLSFGDLLLSSINFQNPLVKGVISKLLKKVNRKQSINTRKILPSLLEIAKSNNISQEDIFLELDKSGVGSLDYEFIISIDKIELYKAAKVSESKIGSEIVKIINEHFEKANTEEWNKVFTSLSSREIEVLDSVDFSYNNTFAFEAFRRKLNSIFDSNDNTHSQELSKLSFFIEKFKPHGFNIENAIKDIRDILINKNNVNAERFIYLLGPLLEFGKIEQRASDAFRTIFKSEFLDNVECIDVMLKYNKQIKYLISTFTKNETNDFIKAIESRDKIAQVSKLKQSLGL